MANYVSEDGKIITCSKENQNLGQNSEVLGKENICKKSKDIINQENNASKYFLNYILYRIYNIFIFTHISQGYSLKKNVKSQTANEST